MKNDSLAKFYWTKDQFHEVWQLHSLKFTSLPEWCIMLINSSTPLLINDTDKKDVPCCMGDRTGNYKPQDSQMFIFKNDMTHGREGKSRTSSRLWGRQGRRRKCLWWSSFEKGRTVSWAASSPFLMASEWLCWPHKHSCWLSYRDGAAAHVCIHVLDHRSISLR